MKVLKKGIKNKILECPRCKAVLEVEEKDFEFYDFDFGPVGYVICPECGGVICEQ